MCNVVGAVTDKDDDYCAYYIMTVVDVRSLVRPTRSHKYTGTSRHTVVCQRPRKPCDAQVC